MTGLIFLIYDMIETCKELAEILLKTPNARVTVSIDDGAGFQCDAKIVKVEELGSGAISIIPEEPELLD